MAERTEGATDEPREEEILTDAGAPDTGVSGGRESAVSGIDRRGFRLAAPGMETRRALEVSGLDRHFLVHDTVPEALEAAR